MVFRVLVLQVVSAMRTRRARRRIQGSRGGWQEPRTGCLSQRAFLKHGGFEAARDDIVDALVAALCAAYCEECQTLPAELELDAEGLRMQMVYWRPSEAG